MKKSNRYLAIAGCILLSYAIVAAVLHLPASKFCANMAFTFFLFEFIRWIGGMSENKKTGQPVN